jgi:hypothetical protein
MTGMHHHAQLFIDWDRVSLTFCPGWPQTKILPISVSQKDGIIGMSHHAQPQQSMKNY